MPSPTPIAKSTSILWQGKVYAPLGEIVESLKTRAYMEANAADKLRRTSMFEKSPQREHAANVLDRVAAELMEEFGEEIPE